MNSYKYQHQLFKWPNYGTLEKEFQARQWCLENFGEECTGRWGLFIDGFNFNSEKDYIWFLLRWA